MMKSSKNNKEKQETIEERELENTGDTGLNFLELLKNILK